MEISLAFPLRSPHGKPNASEQTVEIAKVADLVVIPTGQTIDDLHPGLVLAHSLGKKRLV